MAATGGTGGLGALPLAGVGAAVVVVGGAVMAWLGVFDSDDVRRIVDRATTEESEVVISPSAGSPVITEGLSLQSDTVDNVSNGVSSSVSGSDVAGDISSGAASDPEEDQARDVVAPQIQSEESTAASEASGTVVSTTEVAEGNPISPSAGVVPVSPAETAQIGVTDERGSDAQVALTEEPDTSETGSSETGSSETGSPETGEMALAKTEAANGSVETADTQTAQAQEQVVEAPAVVEPELKAPALEAPRLDLVRIDPTGQAVIAGRAAQGVQVSILLDGEVLEKVDVQPGGDFVSLTSIRPSATARVISLRAEADGQQRLSETSFILAPASQVPAMALAESTQSPAAPVADGAATKDVVASDSKVPSETASAASSAQTSDPVANLAQSNDAVPSVSETGDRPVDVVTADTSLDVIAKNQEDSAVSPTPGVAEEGEQIASVAQESVETQPETAPVASISPADVTTQAPEATAPSDVVREPDTNLRTTETTASSQPDATSAGTTEEQADVEVQPAPRPEATQVAVLRADADGVILVQPVAQQPQGKVVLDTISYSDSGEVQLAGRAQADTRVLVYLDNASAGQFVAGSNGSWSGGLEAVVPGVYTLRLDEVNADGKVLSRLETPFKREAPEVLRPPVTDDAGQGAAAPLVRAVTVQKGDTLWAISQQRYGSGFLYVRVFAANQGAIRDPDLIYPGQVFTIPE